MLFHHNQFVPSRRFGSRVSEVSGRLADASAGIGTGATLDWRRVLPELSFYLFTGVVGLVLLYSL